MLQNLPAAETARSIRHKKAWEDPARRAAASARSKLLWKNPEVRRACSQGLKRSWADPQVRNARLQTKRNPEVKKRMSEAVATLWQDPIYRARMSFAHRKPLTSEQRTKIGQKTTDSPEWRVQHSACMVRLWKDPSFRQRQVDAFRTPASRRRRKQAQLKVWGNNTPDGRKKIHARIAAVQQALRLAKPNKPESQLKQILDQSFPGEFRINVKGETVIGGKIPDFVNCNGKKVVVELFGDYWHSWKVTKRSRKEEMQHRERQFVKWGFKTAIVWESELKDPVEVVQKVLKAMA